MPTLTIMDSLNIEREKAAREAHRIVDAKKARSVMEYRRAVLPNLAIRRPARSPHTSPSSRPVERSERTHRLKLSSYKNAQAWLNKAKSQVPPSSTSAIGVGVGVGVGVNASSGSNGAGSGRPSTLADFVVATRSGMSGVGDVGSTSNSGKGANAGHGSNVEHSSSSTSALPFSAASQLDTDRVSKRSDDRASVDLDNIKRDPTPEGSATAESGQRKRPRFSRSTAGCLGCRKQKVKCDETLPRCLKCIAAERECVWPPKDGRKRRKRGTVGKGKDSGLTHAMQAAAEIGEDSRSGRNASRSVSIPTSTSGIKPRTSMTRHTSGLGSSGSGGSSDEDDMDEDGEGDSGGAAPTLVVGKDDGGPFAHNTAGIGTSMMPDTPGFSWDFTSQLLSGEHDVHGQDGGARSGDHGDSGVAAVLRMGLNSAVGPSHSTSYGGPGGSGSSYLRSHVQAHGSVGSGADEVLGSHNMPTPSSVHSQSGMGVGSGMGLGTQSSQAGLFSMHDSPTFTSPTASTGMHSLLQSSNIGMSSTSAPATSTSGIGVGIATSMDISASSGRQGTVSPSQLLLPRLTTPHAGAAGPGGGLTMTAPGNALSPPQLIDLSKSTLLAKRKDKAKYGSSSSTTQDGSGNGANGMQMLDVTPAQLRMAMVEMILQAFSFDEGLFEFGPSHRTRNLLNTLTTPINTDFLSLAFPSPAARLLFHHYCNVTSRLLITMGNVGPNPLLALCTPLKLLDTASAWAGAIRMSILSISATHFAHETESSVGKDLLGEEWEGKRVRLKELSRKFKKAALCNVYLGTGGDDPHQIDSILAACTLLCIRDVIDADETWQDNLEFALHMISKRGGPLAMLKASDTSFTRRYLLENLAVHDVFGCFITGKEPALLGNYDPWWFDSVDSSTTRWEWESVEQTFGISRTVVDLLARIAALDSRKRRLEINLARNPEEMNDVGQYIYRECQNLLFELDILGNSLSALPQHVRVTCGDYIYKYTAAVYVLADIMEEPPSTPRIVRDVASILELCSEASAMRMSVMLIWPLLIAGTFCLPDIRPKVEELFDVFEPYYAEDLPAARLLLREQWKGMDEGKGKRSWREVMKAANKFVLLI